MSKSPRKHHKAIRPEGRKRSSTLTPTKRVKGSVVTAAASTVGCSADAAVLKTGLVKTVKKFVLSKIARSMASPETFGGRFKIGKCGGKDLKNGKPSALIINEREVKGAAISCASGTVHSVNDSGVAATAGRSSCSSKPASANATSALSAQLATSPNQYSSSLRSSGISDLGEVTTARVVRALPGRTPYAKVGLFGSVAARDLSNRPPRTYAHALETPADTSATTLPVGSCVKVDATLACSTHCESRSTVSAVTPVPIYHGSGVGFSTIEASTPAHSSSSTSAKREIQEQPLFSAKKCRFK